MNQGIQEILGYLFNLYKPDLKVKSVDIEGVAELVLSVPVQMFDEFTEIMGHRRRDPRSFWKNMSSRDTLTTIPESNIAQGLYGTFRRKLDLLESLEYLGKFHAHLEKHPRDSQRLLLRVTERV